VHTHLRQVQLPFSHDAARSVGWAGLSEASRSSLRAAVCRGLSPQNERVTGDQWIQTYLLHLEQERAALLTASAAEQQQFGHPHDDCTLPAGNAGARAHGLGYG
jgi:hypothetical protein